MNKQMFFNMNITFEKEVDLLRQNYDKAFLQASVQQTGYMWKTGQFANMWSEVQNWASSDNIQKAFLHT